MKMTPEHKELLLMRMQELLPYDPRTLNDHGRVLQTLAIIHDNLENQVTPQDVFGDVFTFHKKMGILYKGSPRVLSGDLQEFRTGGMREELAEYVQAVEFADAEGQLDAIIDLIYFALGTIHLCGWDGREAWRRVHEKNMQKRKAESANESKRGYIGDVVKPPGWTPPVMYDLVGLIAPKDPEDKKKVEDVPL